MRSLTRTTAGRIGLLTATLALALTLACSVAPRPAAAAPPATLTLQELQTLLNASPSGVTGTFRTVVGGGIGDQFPVTIPMKVLSIVGNAGPDGALILFQADMNDTVMARIGNLAQGMSGSPLYVRQGNVEKLIGAFSYLDIFTTGGLGLATPIEYMTAIEARHDLSSRARCGDDTSGAPASRTLSIPLAPKVRLVDGAVLDRIVVAPDAAAAARIAPAAGTAVFSLCAALRIGGLPYASLAYKALAQRFEARGYNVLRTSGTGPDGWNPSFTTPLVGGAALAAMYSRGDMWFGALGTVTYVDGDHLLAFGHPMDWMGTTSLYLDNAYIDGIWSSSLVSYKLGEPGALRGSITQDRGSGIGGRLDQTPAEVPVTSSATVTTDATNSATSSTFLTQFWADKPDGAWIAASAVAVPIYRASDAVFLAGSATTTTTVVVSDGTRSYTVTRTNLWDDGFDVQYAATVDVQNILQTLTANPDGIAPATVKSVDLQTTADTARRAATIVDVAVPGGLCVGENAIEVSLNAYGVAETQTVTVTLTIPEGTPTQGTLAVAPAAGSSPSAPATRQTLAQVVDALNAAPTNDMVKVTFTPTASSTPGVKDSSEPAPAPAPAATPVTATADTGWVASGQIAKVTANLTISAWPARIRKGRRVTLTGSLVGVTGDGDVQLYRRFKGERTAVLVATLPVVSMDGTATFTYRSGPLRKPVVFTAVWAGDQTTLADKASATVGLRNRR